MTQKNQETIFVVAPTSPKYSEAWMQKLNNDLQPNMIFIALVGQSAGWTEQKGVVTYTVLAASHAIPDRLLIKLKLEEVIDTLLRIFAKHRSKNVWVLCHYLTTALSLKKIWRKSNITCLVHCHGHDVTWDKRFEKFPLLTSHGLRYKKNVRELIGEVSIISNSNWTTRKILEVGFSEKNIHLRYLGVDSSEIKMNGATERSPLNILYLGRLTDCKGPVETIKAFSLALEHGLNAKLDIVGDGPLRKQCESLVRNIRNSEHIIFHGAVSHQEAMQFYRMADIFTAHNKLSKTTRQEEAFGVSILEAMAHGLPIITGRSGGVIETVVDSINGILFDPEDIEAHSMALLSLCNSDTRRRMSINSRIRVENKFDLRLQPSIRDIFESVQNV